MDNRNMYGGRPPEKNNNGLMIAVVAGIVFFGITALILSVWLVFLAMRYEANITDTARQNAVREERAIWEDDFDFDNPYLQPEEETIPKDEPQEPKGEYYEGLKDAVVYDLDYQIKWEEYSYDTDYEYVFVESNYPVLEGENIPNVEYLNDYIYKEVLYWTESFETYVDEGGFADDDEFYMEISGYVTYMDEEKISIVFSEEGYMQGEGAVYLYSINIDVQNGVVLENSSILNMDDTFVVEFRERNRVQNAASGYIDSLSDQEIAEYLNSPLFGIAFYTPLGMEVGININGGWYTVTYKDYEKYIRKF